MSRDILVEMGLRKEWVVQQAVVDVQYDRGFVFLDKCGSLLLTLEDTLGKPFTGNVASMEHGELRSPAERLVVTYGSRSFNVSQHWVTTIPRIEQLAPLAWEKVVESLNVGRHVTRCAARFVFLIGTETRDEAEVALAECRLTALSDPLRGVVGSGPVRAFSVMTENERVRTRVAFDTMEITVSVPVHEELDKLIPRHGVTIDVDNIQLKDMSPFSRGDLKEFIRTNWQRSRSIARLVSEHLGVPNA